jgi:hypothetical protein
MRRAIIAVLALASSSSQAVVRSIGFHQYMVSDAGAQVFAKANEICATLGRMMMPLGVPSEEAGIAPGKQFEFECILAYEIVPSSQGTYTIHVPTDMMLAPAEKVCPPPTCPIKGPTQLPDVGPASEKAEKLARTYCAKANKTMVVTGGGFDTGPGLTLIFKCATRERPSR